jgi:uncharacterized membrane protein
MRKLFQNLFTDPTMTKTRMESFSDGVLAILITIMVLEPKAPATSNLKEMEHLIPDFISYIISFIMIGVYWINHHHAMNLITHVNTKTLWANLNVLFWISHLPFATVWMGKTDFSLITVAVYIMLQAIIGFSFVILRLTISPTLISDLKTRIRSKKRLPAM